MGEEKSKEYLGTMIIMFCPLCRVGSYQEEVRKVLAEQLLVIFKLYPHLVVDFHRDILDYLGNLRTLTSGGEHCYMHLVSAAYILRHMLSFAIVSPHFTSSS